VPIGVVFSMLSLIGRVALRESSAISVVVKTLTMDSAGLSEARGVLERVRRPISGDAVDERISTSCRLGGKSFSLEMER
jgi:hypothetical protein